MGGERTGNMAAMSDREKTDWIFDFFDVNKNGSLEIEEVWNLMQATTSMNESQARQALTKEMYTEMMMPMLGGGTSMDKDQFYRSYTECGAGDINDDYTAASATLQEET